MRRVVIAPHQDDESMGCGGLLAKYPDECLVVCATDSGPVRQAEHERAMAALGTLRMNEVEGLFVYVENPQDVVPLLQQKMNLR